MALAEELRELAPFGNGNPAVSLLVPGAELEDPRPMGEGRHVRFTVRAGGVRARAVAFGGGSRLPIEAGVPADASFALEVNEYNGAVEPRLVLRSAGACQPPPIELVGEPATYLEGVWAQLTAPLPGSEPDPPAGLRAVRDRRGRGLCGALAALVADGEPVLVIGADATLRAKHLSGRAGGFALCSHAALAADPRRADGFAHVAVLDPPGCAYADALVRAGAPGVLLHLLWGESEQRFAARVHERDHDLRASLPALYRALRAAGSAGGEQLAALLRGEPASAERPAALAGWLLRVLGELELIDVDAQRGSVTARAERATSLERSPTFAAHVRRLQEGRRLLGASAAQAA
jgi:single-stranded-DNA-specific exonuclease